MNIEIIGQIMIGIPCVIGIVILAYILGGLAIEETRKAYKRNKWLVIFNIFITIWFAVGLILIIWRRI